MSANSEDQQPGGMKRPESAGSESAFSISNFSRPTIPCRLCGQPIDEAQAAEDYDAGVKSWDLCERCAVLDEPEQCGSEGRT